MQGRASHCDTRMAIIATQMTVPAAERRSDRKQHSVIFRVALGSRDEERFAEYVCDMQTLPPQSRRHRTRLRRQLHCLTLELRKPPHAPIAHLR